MANPTWKNPNSDNWTTPADWSTGAEPALGDTVTIAQGDPQITSAVPNVASVTDSAQLSIEGSGSLTTTDFVTDTGFLGVDDSSSGGSSLTVGGTLTDSGSLMIGNNGLTSTATVSAQSIAVTGSGALTMRGGSSTGQATLKVNSAAGFGTAKALTGNIDLAGNTAIQFASGQISSVASGATLSLSGANALIQEGGLAGNSALTGLASNAGTINLTAGSTVVTNTNLINTGTLGLDGFGGIAGGSSLTIGGVLTNSGMLSESQTSKITTNGLTNSNNVNFIGGLATINGAISNTGSITLGNLGVSANVTATAQSLSSTGSLTLEGPTSAQTSLNIAAAAGFGTAGRVTGSVTLLGNALLEFTVGQITDITATSSLSLQAADAYIADAGATGSNSALKGLSTIEGRLDLENGAVLANTLSTTGLTNSGALAVDNNGNSGSSSLKVTGTLTNTGTVQLGNTYNLNTASVSTAGAIVNTGDLRVFSGGNTTTSLASLTVAGAAGFGPAGTTGLLTGTVDIENDSSITFQGNGQITDIQGTLDDYGATSSIGDASDTTVNSALKGLSTIEGRLDLENGNVLANTLSTTGLTNSGALAVDNNGNSGSSSLKVTGTLTNTGTVQLGNTYNLNTASVSTAGAIVNTGDLRVFSGGNTTTSLASLTVAGAAGFGPAGTTGLLTGTVDIENDSSITFQGNGQITDIQGTLDDYGATSSIGDASDTTVNSALKGLSTIEGRLDLENGAVLANTLSTTGLTNSGALAVDNNGNSGSSSLKVTGTLTNTGTVQLGNTYNLNTASVSTAGAIVNTGDLRVFSGGNTTTSLASLTVASAAGFGPAGTTGLLTGTVDIENDSSITFQGNGQITDIQGTLDDYGATSSIGDASDTTVNSALKGLSTIEGRLDLENGNVLANTLSTTGLTNSGALAVDNNGNSGSSSLKVTGTLTNTGTVQLGNTYNLNTASVSTAGAIVNTGDLRVFSGGNTTTSLASLTVAGAAGFGPAGTTGLLTGTVDIENDSSITFQANGQITDIQGTLDDYGATSSIGDASDTTVNSALKGLSTIEGRLDLENGAVLANTLSTTGLTNSGALAVDNNGNSGSSSLKVTGTLTNTGTVQLGNTYNLNTASVSTAGAIVNTGDLRVFSGGNTTTSLASLTVAGAAGFGPAGTTGLLTGTVDIENDSSITFQGNGQITDIQGTLDDYGATSSIGDASDTTVNSALKGLSTIEGRLDLENGNVLANTLSTTGLTNSGTLAVDNNGNSGGSSLKVTGTLTNTGTVQLGNTFSISAPAMVTAAAVVNTGTINVAGTSTNAASLLVAGAASNSGALNANAFTKISANGFTQGTTGSINLEIQGQAAGQFATIASSGSVTIQGGGLIVPVDNTSLAAGQTYDLLTETAGDLAGIFNTIDIGNVSGDGTSVNLGNGLIAGLVYGDAAGHVELQVVATPTSTTDTFTGGAASWATGTGWSAAAAPTFYSDVVIGSTASAKVTLGTDATVNSLTLNAMDTLTTAAATDLSIGSTVSVATGAIFTVGGEMFADGAATDNGSIVVNGTVADIRGASSGSGTYTLGKNATLEFGSSDTNTVNFGAANTTLKLDAPTQMSGTLSGLVATDVIDLVGTSVSSYGVTGNTLTVTEGNGTVLSYTLANQQAGTAFTSQSDGAGGTALVLGTTTVPSFTAVTESPASGDFGVGGTGTITLTPSVAATVTGTPTLTLNDTTNGSAVATYDAAKSTSTKLVFDYTVAAGQNAAALAATTLNLPNGAAIQDGSGNNFNVAIGTLSQKGPQIDTSAPSVAITSAGGNVAAAIQTVMGTVDTADAGTTVSLYDNGGTTAIGTATVQSNGSWSSSVTLVKGANSLLAKDTDAAGNTGTSSTVLYTYGVPPATTEALAQDTGSSGSDKLTSVDTVTGSGDTNAVVSFTIDGTKATTTATANAQGVYSYTPAGLADGSHMIVASETNSFGTTTASLTFVLDTTAPVVAITSPGGNVTTASQAISGTVDVADAGTTVSLYDNGSGSALGTATVGAGGAWSTSVTLAAGANSLVARDTDAAGNVGSSAAVAYSLGVVPTVTEALATDSGSSNSDKITNVDTVTGTGAANAVVSFTIDGTKATTTATANTAGVYSYTPASLADGSHTIVASETNAYGTGSSTALTFTLDTTKPVVTEALATDSGTSGTDKITNVDTVTGGGDANAVVRFTVDGVAQSTTATANAAGVYTFAPTGLSDAAHTIVASETDVAGNVGTASLTFTQDTKAPVVAITSAGGNVTAAGQTVAGTVTDANPGTTVTLYDNGSTTALGTATLGANGAWSTAVTLASGANSLVAKDTDLAGNTGSSAAVIYTVGNAPAVTETLATDSGASATDKITNTDTVTGTGAANAVVSFTIDGTAATTTATANAAGVYSYTPASLADGSHTIVASETNSFGTNTASLTFTLDTTKPVVTEALATDSGSSTTDKITNVDTVTGGGDPNAVVTFTVDGVKAPTTATANAAGTYSYTQTGLADGSHTIVASETDVAGNVGTASLTFVQDTTAPTVKITSAGGNVTAAGQTVAGTVTDANPGTTVTLYDNGSTTALGTATLGANGAWSTAVTLASGANSLVAKDTDLAGNTGSSAAVVYTVGNAPAVTETLATDSGASATDKITNTDTVTGTGAANAVVSFTIDGTAATTTATANAAGVYSYTPASLADGSHTIVASETNSFGTNTASLTFTLDTTKPVVTEALATDSGSSTTDKITNVDTVTGGGDPNAVVTFTVDGVKAPTTATANAAGTYSYTQTGLADGSHTIVASETDVAGNVGTASLTFTQDTKAPVVAITSAGGNVTAAGQTVAGTVTDANPGTTVTLYDNGSTTALGTATLGANGAWSTAVTLASGANSLVAKDTDIAGNTGSSAAVVYTLSVTRPAVAVVSDTPSRGNLTTGQTDAITLTMSAPVIVTGAPTLSLNDGGTATYDAKLSTATTLVFSYTAKAGQSVQELAISGVNLPAGASVKDASGDPATFAAAGVNLGVAVNFTQTITGTENLEIVGPSGETDIFAKNAAGILTLDNSAHYTGTVQGLTATDTLDLADLSAGTADKATYAGTATGGTLTVTDGTTTSTIALTGDYTTSKFFVANDGAGGVAVTEVPLPPITEALASDTGASKTDNVTNNPTLTGTGDATATVTFSENGTIIGTTTAAATGKWTYKPTLADGTQTVQASETNAAGTAVASLTFTLDTVKPAVTEVLTTDTGTSATDKITSKDTLTGTGDPNAIVSFMVDGTAIATTVQADAGGVWSFTPAGLLDGSHTVIASETDLAGNTGTASLKFTLDTTPPKVAITSAGGNVTAVSQTITGTGEAGTSVSLFDGTTAIGTAITVGSAGTWSEKIALPALGANPITAQDTDTAGNVGTSAAVTYTLVNVPPTISSGGGGTSATYIVNQGSAPITTVAASDPDPGDTVTYGLLGADGKPIASVPNFAIDQHSGALTLTGSPAAGPYTATLAATDNHGASSTQGITVDVAAQGQMVGDTGLAGVTDTFVFNPNFGIDFVENFRVADTTVSGGVDAHGVLSFDHTLFSGATAGETGAGATAVLSAASVQFGKDTLVYASNNNVIDLQGVNRASLLAHPTDIAFT